MIEGLQLSEASKEFINDTTALIATMGFDELVVASLLVGMAVSYMEQIEINAPDMLRHHADFLEEHGGKENGQTHHREV